MLLENETTEEAFRHLLPAESDGSAYHSRLQKILQAQASIKKINDARQADCEEHKISKEDDEPQLMGEAIDTTPNVWALSKASQKVRKTTLRSVKVSS